MLLSPSNRFQLSISFPLRIFCMLLFRLSACCFLLLRRNRFQLSISFPLSILCLLLFHFSACCFLLIIDFNYRFLFHFEFSACCFFIFMLASFRFVSCRFPLIVVTPFRVPFSCLFASCRFPFLVARSLACVPVLILDVLLRFLVVKIKIDCLIPEVLLRFLICCKN